MRNTEAQRRGVTWPGSHQLKNGRTRTQPKFLEEKSGPPPHPPFGMTQLPSIRKFAEGFDLCAYPYGQCSSQLISSLPQHSLGFQTHPYFLQLQIHQAWRIFFFSPKKLCCEGIQRNRAVVVEGNADQKKGFLKVSRCTSWRGSPGKDEVVQEREKVGERRWVSKSDYRDWLSMG